MTNQNLRYGYLNRSINVKAKWYEVSRTLGFSEPYQKMMIRTYYKARLRTTLDQALLILLDMATEAVAAKLRA